MTSTVAVLLLCQLAGELVARLVRAPVPGPVLGMLFLFALLCVRPRTNALVEEGAQLLLRHLSLLFVPAGVGLMRHAARLRAEWLAIALAVIASTALTLAVSAVVFEAVARAQARR
jgi:holin-like protein